MRRVRVIPVLLIQNGGLVKTVNFKHPVYVGDPINAVKIFNEKEIDEIAILDIDATRQNRGPDMARIKEIAGEAFIPLSYGGGISNLQHINELFYLGVEKVIFNHQAVHNLDLLTESAKLVGSQSIVASIDVRKNWFGKYEVVTVNGTKKTGIDPVDMARRVVDAGAGEIFLNSVEHDGTYKGYDLQILSKICAAVSVPVITCGGASGIPDFLEACKAGASAVAAGSMFVFQRPHQAVLISYPSQEELKTNLFEQL
jgi:imidazole glycerol-phosphate synthase subunit HisF